MRNHTRAERVCALIDALKKYQDSEPKEEEEG